MVKKIKSRNMLGKLILPITFLAIAMAAMGGYWLAGNVFSVNGDGGPRDEVARGAFNPAFSPPGDNKSSFRVNRPNPFTPWQAYEEKLPDDIYEPPHTKFAAPSISDGNIPAWIKNAISHNSNGTGPLIAIVIDDMGVDRGNSEKMWKLPPPLTLAFLTYADDLEKQTRAARAGGHELMLHVSMEPGSKTVDAGPNVLMTGMEKNELKNLVAWGMDRFDGYIGINNHMGSRFTEDEEGMRVVMAEVKKRGLMFLDSRTSAKTVGPRVALELGVPHLERNVFLDNEPVVAAVNKQLAEVEALATRRGVAIAIGHPREGTIDALAQWLPKARARGFQIVPLSAVLKNRLGIGGSPN